MNAKRIEELRELAKKNYADMVPYFDQQIGYAMEEAAEHGLREAEFCVQGKYTAKGALYRLEELGLSAKILYWNESWAHIGFKF